MNYTCKNCGAKLIQPPEHDQGDWFNALPGLRRDRV
jgi:hypothetical protein